MSTRHNRFNNPGGHVGGKSGENRKNGPFEVLGNWLGRHNMWTLGLADELFVDDWEKMGVTKVQWDTKEQKYVEGMNSDSDEDSDTEGGGTYAPGSDSEEDDLTIEDVVKEQEDICEAGGGVPRFPE